MIRNRIHTLLVIIAVGLTAVGSVTAQYDQNSGNLRTSQRGSLRNPSLRPAGFIPQHEREQVSRQGSVQVQAESTAPRRSRQSVRPRRFNLSRSAQLPSVESAAGQSGVYGSRGRVRYARQEEEIIQDNGPIVEEYYEDGTVMDGGPLGNEVVVVQQPYQLISFADMEYSIGVQGFKGVPNQTGMGSFGFNESINWGFPIPVFPMLNLSGQAGARFVQSELYGIFGVPNSNSRTQTFWTAGISRRVDYGLQFGLVVDGLSESWYHDATFAQLRGDLGFVGGFGNQIGFRYTANMFDDDAAVRAGLATIGGPAFPGSTSFDSNDTYRFYYRNTWDQNRGGHAEAFGGFSENGEAIMGAQFMLPIAERWALKTDFSFLPSNNNNAAVASIDEAWNIGMSLTWYPKGLSTWSRLYHRPLMDVADNGTFLFKRQP